MRNIDWLAEHALALIADALADTGRSCGMCAFHGECGDGERYSERACWEGVLEWLESEVRDD